MRRLPLILPLFLLLFGCDTDPVFPVEPSIVFTSITPTAATEFTADEISLQFHYQDGDGDLGYLTDQQANLFITDTRQAFIGNPGRVTAFAFESLSSNARNPSIQGDFTVTLTTPPYESSEEPLVYEVYIVDRAGHESNRILSTPITVGQ